MAGVAAFEGSAIAQPTVPTGITNATQLRTTGAAAFGKTLNHDALGLLPPEAMQSFEAATVSGRVND